MGTVTEATGTTAAVHSRFTEPPPEVIEAIHPTPRRLRSTAVSSIVLPLGPPVRRGNLLDIGGLQGSYLRVAALLGRSKS